MIRIIVGVLLTIVVGCGGGWWYYTTTPEYSLWQLSSSIKERNEEKFRRYFDVHSVAANAVEDLMAEPARSISGPGLIERLLGAAALGWLQPVVVSRLAGSMVNFVRTHGLEKSTVEPEQKGLLGAIVTALRPPSLSDVLRGLGFTSTNFRGIGSVKREEKLAHTDLIFERQPGGSTRVEMELKQQPDSSWRVTRFSNLLEVSREVAAN